MRDITIGSDFRVVWPQFCGGTLWAHVENSAQNDALWNEIETCLARYRQTLTTESLKHNAAIEATRRAYRAFGKDPSRYRPSSEALVRRALQGKPLYRVNTLVDLGNLASMESGYSIGVFDADKIVGPTIELGIGRAGEPYEGIGRGPVNIEHLPVYRDAKGGIGSPTSDNERTKVELSTRTTQIVVNGYDGNEQQVLETLRLLERLLTEYACGSDFKSALFK